MSQDHGLTYSYTYSIGFFGGLLASFVAYFTHFLNFIPFGPGIMLQLLPAYEQTGWMRGPIGHLIGILILAVMSIGVAYLYYFLFRKLESPWIGLWYGVSLWAIIFLGLNPLVPGMKQVRELGIDTNITLMCIFLLYGLFVGYSISYEYQQQNKVQSDDSKDSSRYSKDE